MQTQKFKYINKVDKSLIKIPVQFKKYERIDSDDVLRKANLHPRDWEFHSRELITIR